MPTIATASERLFKSVAESIVKTWNFTKWLADGETLASVPAITQSNEVAAAELTIGSPAVNSGAITIDGVEIAIGKAVQVLVSGGDDKVEYKLKAKPTTTVPQTLQLTGILTVSNE